MIFLGPEKQNRPPAPNRNAKPLDLGMVNTGKKPQHPQNGELPFKAYSFGCGFVVATLLWSILMHLCGGS